MIESKRAQGILTPKRTVARAARKVVDSFRIEHKQGLSDRAGDKKQPTGRAASRAAKHGTGLEKPWRSRMQRTRRRPRTGGWK